MGKYEKLWNRFLTKMKNIDVKDVVGFVLAFIDEKIAVGAREQGAMLGFGIASRGSQLFGLLVVGRACR